MLLRRYVAAGFDTFDMADHYGSAELIIGGRCRAGTGRTVGPFRAFTKWCPEPGADDAGRVRGAASSGRSSALGVERIDLLQFHWWMFEHPAYLDAMRELARLRREGLIGRSASPISTPTICGCCSGRRRAGGDQPGLRSRCIDRRAAEDMSDFCRRQRHRAPRLWHARAAASSPSAGSARPSPPPIADWSKMKYGRFIDAVGGWRVLQSILGAAAADCRAPRRVDRQCRDALGAGAAGGRRGHRRRAARRARAPGRQSAPVLLRARCGGSRRDRGGLRRARGASPAIAATNIAGRRS